MSSRRKRAAARRRRNTSGSSRNFSGEPDFLMVGKLRRPHGVHGEMLMTVYTDFPERLKSEVTIYVGEGRRALQIRSTRHHSKGMLIAFQEIETREQAGLLRNQPLFVRADDRPPLPEGEYYHHQLIGQRVVTDEGQELGILSDILETGANDVYLIQTPEGKEILLPAIEEVILEINVEAGEMRVHLLEGLVLDEERK